MAFIKSYDSPQGASEFLSDEGMFESYKKRTGVDFSTLFLGMNEEEKAKWRQSAYLGRVQTKEEIAAAKEMEKKIAGYTSLLAGTDLGKPLSLNLPSMLG